jgi:hypothetical protein
MHKSCLKILYSLNSHKKQNFGNFLFCKIVHTLKQSNFPEKFNMKKMKLLLSLKTVKKNIFYYLFMGVQNVFYKKSFEKISAS